MMQSSRARPPHVAPVVHKGVRYEQAGLGMLAAFDAKSGAKLWTLRVYETEPNPNIEADVQAVYFARMTLVANLDELRIEDEARRIFRVDLNAQSLAREQ